MEQKTITATILATLITSLAFIGGINLYSEDVYYCEDRSMVMKCDSLSSYYGLSNGKCLNTQLGNKLCRTGWTLITQPVAEIETDKGKVSITFNNKLWSCEGNLDYSRCTSGIYEGYYGEM